MGLWHIDTLDFGDIQHFQSAPGLPFSAFSLAADFFLPAPGSAPPRLPVLLDPFLRKNEQPQTAALNYPFENAFFAHATPRPFPGDGIVEILTAPGPLVFMPPVTTLCMDFGMA